MASVRLLMAVAVAVALLPLACTAQGSQARADDDGSGRDGSGDGSGDTTPAPPVATPTPATPALVLTVPLLLRDLDFEVDVGSDGSARAARLRNALLTALTAGPGALEGTEVRGVTFVPGSVVARVEVVGRVARQRLQALVRGGAASFIYLGRRVEVDLLEEGPDQDPQSSGDDSGTTVIIVVVLVMLAAAGLLAAALCFCRAQHNKGFYEVDELRSPDDWRVWQEHHLDESYA